MMVSKEKLWQDVERRSAYVGNLFWRDKTLSHLRVPGRLTLLRFEESCIANHLMFRHSEWPRSFVVDLQPTTDFIFQGLVELL